MALLATGGCYLHLDRGHRLATVILGSRTEVQDAAHDAFVTAWRKFESLRDPTRFAALPLDSRGTQRVTGHQLLPRLVPISH